jgi:hypothetical protein
MTALIGIAAICMFVLACRKVGFQKAVFCACLLTGVIPCFAYAGLILAPFLDSLGVQLPSMPVQIIAAAVIIAGAIRAAKQVGWNKVLGWAFSMAVALSAVVIIGFLFLMMGIVVHATVPGLIFILVVTFILVGVRNQARGQ